MKLVRQCPVCRSREDHCCSGDDRPDLVGGPFMVDRRARLRERAKRRIPVADLCAFCEEARAVADTYNAAPICGECSQLWRETWPNKGLVARSC